MSARYSELLARPEWTEVALVGLADPADEAEFNRALWCASRLGLPVLDTALDHLRGHPDNVYVWFTVTQQATAETIGQIADLARAVLPVDEICSGATLDIGLRGPFGRALETVVTALKSYPETAPDLVTVALSGQAIRLRRMALRTLCQWPDDYRERVAAAAAVEPEAKLRAEMEAYPALEVP